MSVSEERISSRSPEEHTNDLFIKLDLLKCKNYIDYVEDHEQVSTRTRGLARLSFLSVILVGWVENYRSYNNLMNIINNNGSSFPCEIVCFRDGDSRLESDLSRSF